MIRDVWANISGQYVCPTAAPSFSYILCKGPVTEWHRPRCPRAVGFLAVEGRNREHEYQEMCGTIAMESRVSDATALRKCDTGDIHRVARRPSSL